MTKLRIAINGFGRIGRCVFRAHLERVSLGMDDGLEFVVINLGHGDAATYSHLLQYDSTHGFLPDITAEDDSIKTKLGRVKTVSITDPLDLSWLEDRIDVVLECTGRMNKHTSSLIHIEKGAKKVIVSAPCEGSATLIHGVNNAMVDLTKEDVISVGSCTTNCLAPVAKILNDNIGIESGFMTTIHAYTNDQNILDSRHKDLRRARAASLSMIPTSTGAAKSIGTILPELLGKLDGVAVRVPTPNVSMIDLKFSAAKETSSEEINQLMIDASKGKELCGILTVNNKELVSIDFNHNASSAIFDLTQTKVIRGNFCRVVAWYDNEWGFSNRMLDICNSIAKTF